MSVIGSFQMWRSKQALNHWVLQLARQGREEKPEIVFYGREKNRGSARLGPLPLVPQLLQLPGAECFTGGPGLWSRPVDKSHRGIASPSHAKRNRGINWLQLARIQLHTVPEF